MRAAGVELALKEPMERNNRFVTRGMVSDRAGSVYSETKHSRKAGTLRRNTCSKMSLTGRRESTHERLTGNAVRSEIIAGLEYGTPVLGIRAILVLGHVSCGAVKAAIQGTTDLVRGGVALVES